MNKNSRIYIAGHRGLAGSAILSTLYEQGFHNCILRTHAELDLQQASAVDAFFSAERPEYVFLAAAKVGGIMANHTYPADFIKNNLQIQTNVIDAAYKHGVKRLLFLGSSCIYPRACPQPIREEYLLTGPLEPTNQPYAVAKIAGIEMCWSYNRQYGTRYLAVMPTNLYGPGDNYDLQTSHVMPALLRKIYLAAYEQQSEVLVWGTGTPRREFLYSSDFANACVYLMNLSDPDSEKLFTSDNPPLVNIGYGEDITIRELAEMIAEIAGFRGKLVFDTSKPDGTPRKLLDSSRLHGLGWRPAIDLRTGISLVANSALEILKSSSISTY